MTSEERWCDVPGYLGNHQVSDHGNLRTWVEFKQRCMVRLSEPVPIAQSLGNQGYMRVRLRSAGGVGKTRDRFVHSIVLEAFAGPRPVGLQCAHLNGNRRDNTLANLKWATCKENLSHRVVHGTDPSGERNPNAKLDERTVRAIRALRARGLTLQAIADDFGLTETLVCSVCTRRTWNHVA